ncbi:MAG TPA: helix-turn-helix domain-containing protein [Chloroflexota bacterium]|nr:helix-turn-helix domain-containing protein [Chloroflexota bacterium]
MSSYTIGELEELAGVPRRTIYFYVQQGILPPPHGAGLAARYDEVHLARLRAIPRLRAEGRRLDEIRALFEARPEERPPTVAARESLPLPPGGEAPLAPEPVRRYRLADGVELLVEADLDHERAERVRRLLQAAREIFH